jgi:RHS repeat-associated protein
MTACRRRAARRPPTSTLADPTQPLDFATLTDITTVNGKAWQTVFDAASQTSTSTSPLGRQTFASFDAHGHIASTQVAGLLATSFGYDPNGHLQTITQGTRVSMLGYGPDGLASSSTDALSETTGLTRDAAGRVKVQTLPDGHVIGFGYDPNGNMSSVTPPEKPEHDFGYSPVDLLASYDPPTVSGSGTTDSIYTHDADRQLTDILRPDAIDVHRTYDPAGRLQTVVVPTGTATFAYSPTTGNLASITGPYGVDLAFGYDGSLLQDISYSGAVSGALHVDHDSNFRVSSQSFNGSLVASFAYDDDGLLRQAGALTLTTSPVNGLLTGTTLGGVVDSYGYNAYGEVESYAASYAGSGVFAEDVTPRDALGRISTKTETVQGVMHTYGYTYDARGRLTDVTIDGTPSSHYEYDANGNRLSKTVGGVETVGVYDDQDRMTSYGDATYTYGANGELISKTEGSATTTYMYDALDNLLHVGLPDGTNIDYIVDGQNRRVGKKVNGVVVAGFLYQDALRIVTQLDGSGHIVATFSFGSKPNVPDYMTTSAGVFRIVSDHLGSPRLVINSATGAIVEELEYDEFGNVLVDTQPGFLPFGFAGGTYDADTGLVRFGARDYDPAVGRWTSKDPAAYVGRSWNSYAYAHGDAVNYLDSSGLAESGQGGASGTGMGAEGGPVSSGISTEPITTASVDWTSSLSAWLSGLLSGPTGCSKPLNEHDDCTKASAYHLKEAGIDGPQGEHLFKQDYVYGPVSRYDICACADGSIQIGKRGECGGSGP